MVVGVHCDSRPHILFRIYGGVIHTGNSLSLTLQVQSTSFHSLVPTSVDDFVDILLSEIMAQLMSKKRQKTEECIKRTTHILQGST
jgi:hypothetical protein